MGALGGAQRRFLPGVLGNAAAMPRVLLAVNGTIALRPFGLGLGFQMGRPMVADGLLLFVSLVDCSVACVCAPGAGSGRMGLRMTVVPRAAGSAGPMGGCAAAQRGEVAKPP